MVENIKILIQDIFVSFLIIPELSEPPWSDEPEFAYGAAYAKNMTEKAKKGGIWL